MIQTYLEQRDGNDCFIRITTCLFQISVWLYKRPLTATWIKSMYQHGTIPTAAYLSLLGRGSAVEKLK